MAGLTRESPSNSAPSSVAIPASLAPPSSLGGEAWKRFRRHKLAFAGAVLLLLIILAVVLGPFFWTLPINEIDFKSKLQGPSGYR